MYREKSFLRVLEENVERLGDNTRDGRNYNLGYVTALKDEEIITEREFKILANIILWQPKEVRINENES